MAADTVYDPRYLAGIVLFNRGDFFEAHEVWESLWMETFSEEKRFYQALIQAAVGLCHFCNGNVRGAVKLYRSSREYMGRFPSPHLGLDCAALLAARDPDRSIERDETLVPTIALTPPPETWPDPEVVSGE